MMIQIPTMIGKLAQQFSSKKQQGRTRRKELIEEKKWKEGMKKQRSQRRRPLSVPLPAEPG